MKPTKAGKKVQVKVTIHPNLLARAHALADERGLFLSELIADLLAIEISSPKSRSVYAPLEIAEELHAAERPAPYDKPATARRPSGSSKG